MTHSQVLSQRQKVQEVLTRLKEAVQEHPDKPDHFRDIYKNKPITLLKTFHPQILWPKKFRYIFAQIWLGKAGKKIIITGPRGGGKSVLMGALGFCLWFLRKLDIVDMGGSLAQAKIVYGYFSSIIYSIKAALTFCKKEPLQEHTESIDGNYFKALPASPKAVRGPHPSVLLADEVCFTGNQLIISNNEVKRIKDIKIGDKVLNAKGKWQKVVKTYKRKYDNNIVEIKAAYNIFGFKVTPNHPIKNIERKFIRFDWWRKHLPEQKWLKAKKVKKGSALIFPLGKNDKTKDNDWDWFLGLYIAEGSTNNYGKIFISLHSEEHEYIEKVKKIIKEKLNKNVNVYKLKNCKCVNLSFQSKQLAEWLKLNCGHGAGNKRIPKGLLNDCVVQGIIDGDGMERKDKRIATRESTKIRFHIKSEVLIYQLQRYFLNKKEFCSLYHRPESYQLEVSDGVKHFGWFDNDNFYAVVKKIKEIKHKGFVYNIQTEDNTYTIPSALVHNCEAKDEILADALPMVTSSENPLTILTSTFHKIFGAFQEIWDQADELGYTRFSWDIFDVTKSFSPEIWNDKELNRLMPDLQKLKKLADGRTGDPEGWVRIENVIDAWQGKRSIDWFLVEFMGTRPSASGLVNDPIDVEASIFDNLTENKYNYIDGAETIGGIDWGFSSMTSNVVFMKHKDAVKVQLENINYTQVASEIIINDACDLIKKYKIKRYYCDSAGKFENEAFKRELKVRNLRCTVVEVIFRQDKEEMLGNYRAHFQRQKIKIPKSCKEAKWQHKRYRYIAGTNKPVKKDDHIPDATMCAFQHWPLGKVPQHFKDLPKHDKSVLPTISDGMLDKQF